MTLATECVTDVDKLNLLKFGLFLGPTTVPAASKMMLNSNVVKSDSKTAIEHRALIV
jgi:hypothetical protein